MGARSPVRIDKRMVRASVERHPGARQIDIRQHGGRVELEADGGAAGGARQPHLKLVHQLADLQLCRSASVVQKKPQTGLKQT